MKSIIASLVLALSAVSAGAQIKFGETFEIDSQGCLWSDSHATCVLVNRLDTEVICEATIVAYTTRGKVTDTVTRAVRSKRFMQVHVYTNPGAVIRDADAFGKCSVIE